MEIKNFDQLLLSKPIIRALSEEGYQQPTAIQEAAIPQLLAGKDLLATAQTGTGKTAAFVLPMLQILDSKRAKGLRSLILTPTRELALQIHDSLCRYGRYLPITSTVLLGGVAAGPQIRALKQRPNILVATPGRLIDLWEQGFVNFKQIEFFVLDEADRMLDMGFLPDVRRIAKELPKVRHSMLFSATISPEIAELSSGLLNDPVTLEITPSASISSSISQQVLFVEKNNKRALLTEVLKQKHMNRTLVFTRTKHGANRIAQQLSSSGINTEAIHSDKTQAARQRALANFSRGRTKALVATDILARGIDVKGISHVINYELPEDAESYVHRIGRTARAGAQGIALSLCSSEEVSLLKDIEKLTQCLIAASDDHGFHSAAAAELHKRESKRAQHPRRAGRRFPSGPNRQRFSRGNRKSFSVSASG